MFRSRREQTWTFCARFQPRDQGRACIPIRSVSEQSLRSDPLEARRIGRSGANGKSALRIGLRGGAWPGVVWWRRLSVISSATVGIRCRVGRAGLSGWGRWASTCWLVIPPSVSSPTRSG